MIDRMSRVDAVARDLRWRPRWGWHDDHRERDGTPEYLPAVQQVRDEFAGLLAVIDNYELFGGSCLQLGVGPCAASHVLWQTMFDRVVSVDKDLPLGWVFPQGVQGETLDPRVIEHVRDVYDFLFIDAGHSYDDVRADYENYRPMVRSGGLIAFHDALPRDRYPEIKVHEFIKTLPVTIIGTEVGTAVMEAK